MLPRKLLIPLKGEWNSLLKTGRWVDYSLFRVLLTKHSDNDHFCTFAIVVSKKVSLSSVIRHKIKRQFCDAIKDLQFPNGWKLVFHIKNSATKATNQMIKNEIESLINLKLK